MARTINNKASAPRPVYKTWEQEQRELRDEFIASLPHAADLSLLPATQPPFSGSGIWDRGRKVELRRDLMWRGMAVIMGEAERQRERINKLQERLDGPEGDELPEDGIYTREDLRGLLGEMIKSADAAEALGCAIRQAFRGHCSHTEFHGMDSCPFAIITEGEADLAPQYGKHDRHEAFGQLFPERCPECKDLVANADVDMGPVVGGINPLVNPHAQEAS